MAINWPHVNEIVVITLRFLQEPYPGKVKDFLNWYQEMEGSKLPITSSKMINWIKKGVVHVKQIITLLEREIEKLARIIQEIYNSPGTPSSHLEKSAKFSEGQVLIERLIVEFLGCREGVGKWFLGILQLLADKGVEFAENNLEFFAKRCLEKRVELLHY